jgi:long-chain acyl-CoA synthetase
VDFVTRIAHVFRIDPSAPALAFEGRWFRYQELSDAVDELVARLTASGIGDGTPCAAVLDNTPAGVVAILAALQRRACLVPLSPRRPGRDLERARPVAATLRPGSNAPTDLSWILEPGDALAAARPGVAVLLGTAGTTGPPKRIPVTYESIDASLAGTRSKAGHKHRDGLRSDVTIICFPFVHLSGIVPLLMTILTGRRVALMRKFEPVEAARLVREHQITSLALNPTAIAMLLDADLDAEDLASLRYVRSGSAPLSPALAAEFEERFGVVVMQAYGQTETGGEVIGWSPDDHRAHAHEKRGSVGRAHPGIEARIVSLGTSPDADPERVASTAGDASAPTGGADGIGELWLRGVRGKPGWHRTGDLASIDEDGFVWILGRADDTIICGGFNIAPLAVEQVLERHPDVREAAVVGAPDRRLGSIPVALVVEQPGRVVSDEELVAWCRELLEPYQVPRRFVRLAELPRNDAGKIHRPSTRQHALADLE